jgi:hypothetical protein
MRVSIDVEQSIWTSLLMRAHEENLPVSTVLNAWIRRAIRQQKTILPTTESRPKVVSISRKHGPGGMTS